MSNIGVIVACAASVVASAWIPGSIAQSPTAQATGLLVGRVIDGTTDAPVTGALVTLSGPGLRSKRVIVDSRGRFLFNELPAGAFTISATKAGYLDGTYGRLRADGAGLPLELQEAEHLTDATIR